MSILRKIPKIEQVLDNMSIESLKRLESLMNSGNGATETYTLFGGENKLNYVNKDLGVWYCNIELERNTSVETGFLIWESTTKALFISFDITQCLKEYEIDLTNYTYTKINEKLSIEEFRRVLEDNINKEVVHIDTSGNVEIGKNLVVGGKVILNGKQDLVDTSGNELISGGGVLLDIEPYINGDKITQEGYNLVEEKINSGEVIGVYSPSMSMPFILYSYLIDKNGLIGFTFDSPLAGGELTRITIKKDLSFVLEEIVNGSSGSSKVWYELPNLFLLENITQEQFNEIKNLALQNQLAGINCGGFYCPLEFYQDGQNIAFFYPWYENDIFTPHLIGLNTDLSVKIIPYSTITLPQTAPTSQVIPSITTFNKQQNLTIGDGLKIKDGALDTKEKIKIFQPNVSYISTTYSDTSKLITISITPNDMSAYDYINSLVDNNKLFNLSLYLKSAVIDNNCLTFNIPLTFLSSGTDRAKQDFSSPICVASNILGSLTLSFGSANNTINIIFYIPDDTYYGVYKQILAVFTTDTILKLEIKTDE